MRGINHPATARLHRMTYVEGQFKFVDTGPPNYEPISFVIPAHNEQNYLAKTIESVFEACKAVDVQVELIVVNDDSTDQTLAIAQSAGARTVNVKLRNIGAVRNAGAQIATHPWLFFIDADTRINEKTLRQSLDSLANGAIGGGARVDLDSNNIFWVKRILYYGVVLGWQIVGGWAAGCFMFCRKKAFEDFGGFDENYFAAEEMFFSLELKKRGRFKLAQAPVITSARKLEKYSTWELVRFIVYPLARFRDALRSRDGLEILYQDKR